MRSRLWEDPALCWHPNGEALPDQLRDPGQILWGGLLMGKRPPVTARLEPGPTVKTFVTIVPFPSQSRFMYIQELLTTDEEPGFVSVERSDTYVLWNLNAKVSADLRAWLMPQVSRQNM